MSALLKTGPGIWLNIHSQTALVLLTFDMAEESQRV